MGKTFGSSHFHIVGHSNGGNWARTMLAELTDTDNIGVYSLTTISTPFSGTVLADYAASAAQSQRFRIHNFYGFVGWLKGADDVKYDSQTGFAKQWNQRLRHPLNTTVWFDQGDGSFAPETNPVSYRSIASNADANNNWKIDGNEGIRQLAAGQRFALLSTVDSLRVCSLDPNTGRCQPGSLFASPQYCLSKYLRPNDTTVTVYSAQWPNPLDTNPQLVSSCYGTPLPAAMDQKFTPILDDADANPQQHPASANGAYWLKNHTSIGDAATAKAVLAAIQEAQPVQ